MSRLMRFLLVLASLVLLTTPLSTAAGQTTPIRTYGPGGLAPARLPDTSLLARNAVQATAPTAAPLAAQPVDSWSRIAFTSARNGSWDIYSMRPDGTDVRQVTSGAAQDENPAQSPADGRIAFVSDRTGNWDIFSVAADGSGLRQLTADPAWDADLAWSPDGARLAFASNRGGNWDVFVMNADGSGAVPLIAGPEDDWGPAWSPDGQSLAWIRVSGPESGKIWVANADGSNAHPVSNDMRFAQNLAWSPDGRRITFSSDWGWIGFTSITSVGSDGSDPSATLLVSPSAAMTDATMGSYAPDGSSFTFSETTYVVERDGNLYIQRAVIRKQKLVCCDGPVTIPASGINQAPDWQKSDFIAPTSHFTVLPQLAAANSGVMLSWTGEDKGGSGILNYDLQHRIEDGPWVNTYSEPLTEPHFVVTFGPGVVSFRVRARDAASNVEPWPSAAEGDGTVTFYTERYTGFIFDIRRTPVPGVQVQGPNYPSIPFVSGPDGHYDAYSYNDIYTLKVADPAYGELPETNATADRLADYDFVLPSKTNAVQNGGFESGLVGWTQSEPGVAEVLSGMPNEVHSGQGSLRFGKYSPNSPANFWVSQDVTVPPAATRPTLSFFYRGYLGYVPDYRLSVSVIEQGQAPVKLALHERHIPVWSDAWADLAQWGSKKVTLRFEVQLLGGEPTGSMVLDEVTVGEWHTPRITSVQGPAGMTGAITVKGENFEPGAVIRVDDKALATTYVDGGTLTAELAAGVKVGPRALWVMNPGGEEALSTLRVGRAIFLPWLGRSD